MHSILILARNFFLATYKRIIVFIAIFQISINYTSNSIINLSILGKFNVLWLS